MESPPIPMGLFETRLLTPSAWHWYIVPSLLLRLSPVETEYAVKAEWKAEIIFL
jgi:hypothetical protein